MPLVFKRISWVLITLGSVLMFLLAARYFFLDLDSEAAKPENYLRDLYLNRRLALYIHVFAFMPPLILGPLQFLLRRLTPDARKAKYLPLHRWLGLVYVSGAIVGGLAGLYLAIYAYGGFSAALGFGTLASLTLVTTSMAYLRIREGNESAHKEWMTRSYSLIFAAVTLRVWLALFVAALGIEITEAYPAVSWFCWVPNLIVAELINARRRQTENGPTQTLRSA